MQQNLAMVLSLQGKAAEAKAAGGASAANFEVPDPQPHVTVAKSTAKGGKSDARRSNTALAVANQSPAIEPVTQASSTTLGPDEIMRAAMKAEEAKKKAAAASKRRQTVASADDVPSLKGVAP